MGAGHSHSTEGLEHVGVNWTARNVLIGFLAVLGVLTVAGLIWLWPSGQDLSSKVNKIYDAQNLTHENATITDIKDGCDTQQVGQAKCLTATVTIDSGEDAGTSVEIALLGPQAQSGLRAGDVMEVNRIDTGNGVSWSYSSINRLPVLGVLAVLFVAVVLAVARWKGLFALLGLGFAGAVLVGFMLPALITGKPGIAVALVGGTAIMFVVLYVADYAVRKQALMPHLWRAFVPMAIALSVVGMLIMRQPDLGALIVILLVAMGVLFLGGMNPRLFFGMAAFLGFVFAAFILLVPFRRARFFSYLDPFARANAEGSSYQLTHSLMAIGKGEWLGSGLGAGVAKLNFLPEPHTDFLFATIGEELGMVGMLVVILMFFWVVRRCFEIGRQAIAFEEFFNGLVAQGIGLWIGLQVFINLGVNLGLLPTKGLTLPFMSFGGTAILMNCVAMAIVLRIDVENRRLMRGKMA